MKKLLSLLLALTMALSLFACTKPEEGGKEGDGPVTIYLPISRTEYKADGSTGFRQDCYTYSDKGLLLTHTTDTGLFKEIFDEEEMVFIYEPQPFDGTINRNVALNYNDRGHMLWYTQKVYEYDYVTGELVKRNWEEYSKDQNITYHYTDDGKIDYVDVYNVNIGGGTGSLAGYYRHYYDANGRLFEIGFESVNYENTRYQWAVDYRYDAQGRMVASTVRPREAQFIYQYEYNDAGQLARMAYLRNSSQAPLDDQHVGQSWYKYPYSEHSYQGEVVFTYDADGNLTSRKIYDEHKNLIGEEICEYRDGKLYKITDENRTVLITTDEGEAGTADVTLVEDANGNVVKRIESDGSYIVFEYQAFQLSAEEAKIAQNSYHSYNMVDPSGRKPGNVYVSLLGGGMSACQTVTYPVTELYPYDIALQD